MMRVTPRTVHPTMPEKLRLHSRFYCDPHRLGSVLRAGEGLLSVHNGLPVCFPDRVHAGPLRRPALMPAD